MLDLNPVVTEWFEIHRDKLKVKMWGEKMQKLADKLRTPGGEEKLRMKIEKYLKKVPDQFSDGDDERQEYRKQLPDDIIRKLKMKYLNPTRPDVNVYRLELSKYCSRFKTENFKNNVTTWLKNLNIKKKDFLGRSVKKDDVLLYITEKLEPLVLNRPASDKEYKDALRSNIKEIVEELPLVIGRHSKEFVVNRVTDGLVNDLLSIESKLPSSFIQPTVTEIKEFVKDEITFFLEKAHKAISTKRMDCLETELVALLLDLANASDIDNYIVEDITAIFKDTGKLSEYKARYFSNILLRDYKEFFFRQTLNTDNSNNGSVLPDVSSEFQNPVEEISEEYASYNIYTQKLIDEINKWIYKINIPNKNKSFVGVVVKELASDIVDRHKYLEMNPNSKRTDAEEFELLKYEIFKWTSKLTGGDNTTVLDNAQELLDNINTIPKPSTAVSVPPTPDVTLKSKPNLESISDLICDWFEELPEEVYQYVNLNSDLVKDLAKDILNRYDDIYPGLIENMIDLWIDSIFNKKLNRNDGEKLKNRIRNKLQRHIKENERKDPKQEKVIVRSYEDVVDDWIDTIPMDTKKVRHFIKTRNEHIHELALRVYQIKTKYKKAPNDVKDKVLLEGITDWIKKLPLNNDTMKSLNEKGIKNKYASDLASKIQACEVNESCDLRAALKEQLISEQIKVALMDWLKKLPLYINNSPKIKEHQETIIKELAVKLNEHARDGYNPEAVMYDYVKMLDPIQSEGFIKNTVSHLKSHLQTYTFEDISLQLNDSDVLVSNIETWIEKLHLDVKDVTRFNDQKIEFINSIQRLKSSGTDVAVIKKEIITFLRSILLVNNRTLDESTLNNESLKLLESVVTVQVDDPLSKPIPIDSQLICKTVKDWANTLPLKPIYCPKELRWFIDNVSSSMTRFFERLDHSETKDNERIINQEIVTCLKRFPLLEQDSEIFIMTTSKELFDKLQNINEFRSEGCCNDDDRNVTVYATALDGTHTTTSFNNKDFTMDSIKEEDIEANLERYTRQVVNLITDWFDSLDLRKVQESEYKEIVINDLAGDIIDRHKYLELNPESRGTREDEVEHLKYQIFKWINKLVGDENLEAIEQADNLLSKVQTIPVPTLVKSSPNTTNNRMNKSNLMSNNFPGARSLLVGRPRGAQLGPNMYPGRMSPTSNTTGYSIEEVSGYLPNSLSPQTAMREVIPAYESKLNSETTPADRCGRSGSPRSATPSFGGSSPKDTRMSSPVDSSLSPQPGRSNFSPPSHPPEKRVRSLSTSPSSPRPSGSNLSPSSPPTEKRIGSPTASPGSPQPGGSNFRPFTPPTEKWKSISARQQGSPQASGVTFRPSSPTADKWKNNTTDTPSSPQPGRSGFSESSPPDDMWMCNPPGLLGTPQPGRSTFSSSPPADKWKNSSAGLPITPESGSSISASSHLIEKQTSNSTARAKPKTELYRYETPQFTAASAEVSSQPGNKGMTYPNAMTNPSVYHYSPSTTPTYVEQSVTDSPHAGRVSAGKLMTNPDKQDTKPLSAGSSRASFRSQPTGKRGNTSKANENHRLETPPPAGKDTFEDLKPQTVRKVVNSGTSAVGDTPPRSSSRASSASATDKRVNIPAAVANLNEGSTGKQVQSTTSKMSISNASANSNATLNNPQTKQTNTQRSTGDLLSDCSLMDCCPQALRKKGSVGFKSPPTPSPIPQDGTKEAIYEKYQKIFRAKCDALPIDSISPETEKLAELARTGIYNGIIKTFFKLKADPDIENDYGYFEFMLEEKIEEMLDVLPQTEAFKKKRHPWKIDILTNAIDMLDELHGLSDRPSFRQRVRNKFNRKFARELELEECFLLQQGFLAEMADAFILESKYKEDNPVKANIYKNRLMKKIDDLTNHLSKEHNAGFRFFKKPQLARIAMKVLDEVPIPNDEVLKAEAEEIQLADEVEKWYKELPTKPLVNETDGVLRKRMIDLLAKKLYDIEKHGNDTTIPKDEQMKHEVSQFLEKRAKLQDDQDLNINFMVDELNNRLKNRWLTDPGDYSDFERAHPVSSSFAQVNNREVYLAPLMDAATSTNQPSGQSYQNSSYAPLRNVQSISKSAQSEPNQTYHSQGVPMDMSQQQPYSGCGPPGYGPQCYKGVPFQSFPPNQPLGHMTGMGPNNTRTNGYGPQQLHMGSETCPESCHGEENNRYMPQQNMRSPARPSPPGPPGPGNCYIPYGLPIQHNGPRNMRFGSYAGPGPRMHCSIRPYSQCGRRQGSMSQGQGNEPFVNGQQRPYGMQHGQVRPSTGYQSQGQNGSPGHEGGGGPRPDNCQAAGGTALMGPDTPDGEDVDNEYTMRCKCLENYRHKRRYFECDERLPRFNPYRYYL